MGGRSPPTSRTTGRTRLRLAGSFVRLLRWPLRYRAAPWSPRTRPVRPTPRAADVPRPAPSRACHTGATSRPAGLASEPEGAHRRPGTGPCRYLAATVRGHSAIRTPRGDPRADEAPKLCRIALLAQEATARRPHYPTNLTFSLAWEPPRARRRISGLDQNGFVDRRTDRPELSGTLSNRPDFTTAWSDRDRIARPPTRQAAATSEQLGTSACYSFAPIRRCSGPARPETGLYLIRPTRLSPACHFPMARSSKIHIDEARHGAADVVRRSRTVHPRDVAAMRSGRRTSSRLLR